MKRFGKWEIIRKLDAGGQGTAYLALDTTKIDIEKMLERLRFVVGELAAAGTAEHNRARAAELFSLVETYLRREMGETCAALKVLHEEARSDPKALERLAREVEVLADMDHPAIIKILDVSPRDGWFVTPYYPGGALSKHLDRFAAEPLRALMAVRPVVAGVAELHRRMAAHRDIKPDNIFIDGERLILGDFGIVRVEQEGGRSRLSDTYEKVGSTDWMPGWAMSMRVNGEVPAAFDVFGLGKVLWAMVSGRTKMRLWYFEHDEFNLTRQFPSDPQMLWVNRLLGASVVERVEDSWADAAVLLQTLTRS